MQAEYAQHYRTLWERHWWWRSRESYLLGWIARIRGREGGPLRILDVGCGDGLFFKRLEPFGRVEGLEPDASLLENPLWRDRIRVARLGDEFGGERGFDLVLMLDVLEHIADESGALRAARALLRPGGRLLITVPALQWLWSRHDEVNEHHRRYRRDRLLDLLIEAGFEVEDIRYFYFWTVAPLLVRRWVAPAGRGVHKGSRVAFDHAVMIPPAPINRALSTISRAEHALGRLIRWPIGGSLLSLARVSSGRLEGR